MPNQNPQKKKKMIYAWIGFSVLVFLGMFGLYLYQTPQKTEYMWVQYGPGDSWIARVITSKKDCPKLTIDQQDHPMSIRVRQDVETPVTSCELAFPKNTTQVSIGQTILPVPRLHTRKILVIGDTGCRLKGKHDQQCNTSDDWVFPKLAQVAAEINPDLIIHVGDYIYGDKGSTWSYDWQTLEAEFFLPAKPFLTQSPWLFIRGNHEECSRGGPLWLRFQDPYPYQTACNSETDPFLVNLANLQLLAMDTAAFEEYVVPDEQVQETKAKLNTIPLNDNYWLVTHRPLWGNKMLQQSLTKKQLDGMGLSLGGHFHNFESLNFNRNLPPQIIAGSTSMELEKDIIASMSGLLFGGKEITDTKFYRNFGYLVLEEEGMGVWKATEFNPDGQKIFNCEYKERNVSCD